MCLSTLLSFTQHRHVVVLPLNDELDQQQRCLGVFLCLYKSPAVPVLPQACLALPCPFPLNTTTTC